VGSGEEGPGGVGKKRSGSNCYRPTAFSRKASAAPKTTRSLLRCEGALEGGDRRCGVTFFIFRFHLACPQGEFFTKPLLLGEMWFPCGALLQEVAAAGERAFLSIVWSGARQPDEDCENGLPTRLLFRNPSPRTR